MRQHLRVAAIPPLAPSPIPGIERAITVAAAAAEMGADESTVRKLLLDDQLRGYRLGKRGVRIYVSSIRDYQERQTLDGKGTKPAPPPRPKAPPTPAHREAVATLESLGIIRPPSSR